MIPTPCNGYCKNRSATCHCNCSKYKVFKAILTRSNEREKIYRVDTPQQLEYAERRRSAFLATSTLYRKR